MKNITFKVPENNKEVFVEPSIECIPDIVLANRQKIRNYEFEINDTPFQTLRNKTREELLRKSVYYTNGIKSLFQNSQPAQYHYTRNITRNDTLWQTTQNRLHINERALDYESIKNIPIIQTGHEPILYHPGIWIKNHFVKYLTKKLGGVGINMIVDNDACNMAFIYVPILTEVLSSVQKMTLVKNMDNTAYEEIILDDIETILKFKEAVICMLRKNTFDENTITTIKCMQTAFEKFINRITEYYRRGCVDIVGLLTSARSEMEESFGINNLEIPVSWICDTDGFYQFLLNILYRADPFAKIYNSKLAEYRSIHKIRSKANPLPDLKISGDLVELPFWIWKIGGQRERCYILNGEDSMKITNGNDTLVILKKSDNVIKNISMLKTLIDASIKIRPRAITTTIFSRLFFSDVFVHGIGGAKYDTITDEIIKEFFSVEPPASVTISSTLFLPFNTFDTSNECLTRLKQVVNDMRYNPERHAPKEAWEDAEFINRISEKQKLLKMINVGNKDEKRLYFNQIKELNRLLLTKINTEFQNKQREINKNRHALAYNEAVRFREYPVFIYPTKVLREYFPNVCSSA